MVNLSTVMRIDPIAFRLQRAEKIFEVQEVYMFYQLQSVFISMEGEVMRWFSSWCLRRLKFIPGNILFKSDCEIHNML